MGSPRDAVLAALHNERRHVLAATAGLDPAELHRPVAPSGWTIAQLLRHLTYDDEIFWIGAVLLGDPGAIDQVRGGWRADPGSGAEAVADYRTVVERYAGPLAERDLDAAPSWWPPPEVFDFPSFDSGWEVVQRVLVETATHAGHLDLVREQIDGHQHLTV